MYNAHKLNYTVNNICYEHRPLNGVWIDGVNYDEEIKEKNTRIATLEAENARLTAAHAMQGESLVVLPRHMVNSIEEQLKDYKAAARNLAKHLEAINNICEREDVDYQAWKKIRAHCEAANVMEAL